MRGKFTRAKRKAAPPPPVQSNARNDEEPRDRRLVPETARLRTEGRGDLSFKATRDGYVYIVDTRDKKLIFTGPLDEGEAIREILAHLGEPVDPPRIATARGPPLWEVAGQGGDADDLLAQPMPEIEFDQRVGW